MLLYFYFPNAMVKMKTLSLLLGLILTIMTTHTHAYGRQKVEATETGIYYSVKQRAASNEDIVESIETDSVISCSFLCMDNPKCTSPAWEDDKKMCYIMDGNQRSKGKDGANVEILEQFSKTSYDSFIENI